MELGFPNSRDGLGSCYLGLTEQVVEAVGTHKKRGMAAVRIALNYSCAQTIDDTPPMPGDKLSLLTACAPRP